ncbi:MAG: hypothetical protein Q7R81_07505 [Candidatus Peregrinibacteria bacterium]|nr:hypothetical protein [Candidatus Peregrinibacteria bacterium]
MISKQTLFRLCLLVLFLSMALKGLFELGRIIVLEAQGPLDADSTIYFTIGRTLLNGFRLYVDFFDVQPPGMFLLTALSLLVTGDQRLVTGFVVFILAAVPTVIALFAYRESRSGDRLSRALLTLLALTLGILITLYLEERAPTVETQLFGSFFGVLFALVMITYPERFDWKRSLLGALLLLCSILMKEPFLVTNFAVALLLTRNVRHFLHGFLLPLGIGGVVGILLLAWMGILLPYIQSLGTTFALRTENSTLVFGPMIIRPLALHMLHSNLSWLYPASPLLAYLIWYLWSRSIAYRAAAEQRALRLISVIVLLVAFCSGAVFLNTIHQIILVWYMNRNEVMLVDPHLLRNAIIEMVVALILLVPSGLWLHRRRMLRWLVLSLIALGFTSLGVGSSSFSGNHFAFAVPVYAALVLLFLRESARMGTWTPAFLVGSAMTMLVMFPFTPNPSHLASLEHRMGFTYAAQRERITRLDGLMDSCGLEQYYNEAIQEFAMAKHSPYGPLVLRYDYMPLKHPLHLQTAENIVRDAKLIVATEDYEDPQPTPENDLVVTVLHQFIPKNFTKDPPPCAVPFFPIEGVTLWFRKDLSPHP